MKWDSWLLDTHIQVPPHFAFFLDIIIYNDTLAQNESKWKRWSANKKLKNFQLLKCTQKPFAFEPFISLLLEVMFLRQWGSDE